jgi:hypothetical protein
MNMSDELPTGSAKFTNFFDHIHFPDHVIVKWLSDGGVECKCGRKMLPDHAKEGAE